MQANKDQTVEIQETEANCYHVEFSRRMLPRGNAFEGVLRKQKQIYSVVDFNDLMKVAEGTKTRAGVGFLPLGWQKIRILHDPVIWKAEQKRLEKAAEKQAAEDNRIAEAEAKAKEKPEAEKKPMGRPKKS